MNKKRKIELIVRKVTFEQAEEEDVEFYAKNSWKNSAEIVEEMRRSIWNQAYNSNSKREKVIFKAGLKDERDDFE